MPASTAAGAPPPRRRWPIVLLVLLVVLGVGVWLLARLLEPERVSAFLLRQIASATGLELRVASPAQVGLWPDLHVALSGVEARAPGAATPLFTAGQVDAVLPWRSLVDREPVIQRLRLRTPVLQRDAFAQWRAAVAAVETGPPEPMRIPELTASLAVEDGAIVGAAAGDWRLADIDLTTSALREGEAFAMQLSATLHYGDGDQPLDLGIQTVPRADAQALRLDPLQLRWRPEGAEPVTLQGSLVLDGTQWLQVMLEGSIPAWPPDWPAPPEGLHEGPVALTVRYAGPTDGAGLASVHAARGAAVLEAEGVVAAVLDWWNDETRTPLPPLRATFAGERLRIGEAELQGVRAELTPDAGGSVPQDAADGR